jgi:hypothetical protein
MVGLSLAAGQPMSAQSATPSPAPLAAQPATQPAKAAGEGSSAAQTPAKPALEFKDVVRIAEKDGQLTTIRDYIAVDFGLKGPSNDLPPVLARALAANDTHRAFYVIDTTGALLFTVKEGDTRVTYRANHAGVLQQAGRYNPGRFHSETLQSISGAKAATGFAAEKEFWVRKISSPENDETVMPGQAVSKKDHAKPEVDAKKSEKEKEPAVKKAKDDNSDSAPPKKKISWF